MCPDLRAISSLLFRQLVTAVMMSHSHCWSQTQGFGKKGRYTQARPPPPPKSSPQSARGIPRGAGVVAATPRLVEKGRAEKARDAKKKTKESEKAFE